jgi:branched-chain amino acid transport system substrate-binding protein
MTQHDSSRRSLIKAGGAAAAALAFPAIVRAQAKEVTIGGVLPLTGPSAAFGQGSWNALQLACEVANQRGGIKSMGGAQLRAAVVDTESKPEVAASQTEQMIRRGASVLIGCNQSSAAIVASQVAERGQVPFMTAYDIDPAITARGFRYTFRLSPLVNSFADDLLGYIKAIGEKTKRPARRIALLSEGSILGQSANRFATEAAKKYGFEVADAATYDVGKTQNFTPYIAKYKGGNVDVVVGHQRVGDAVLTVRTMKELGYNPMAYGGILGAQASGEYIQNLGKDADYSLSTDAWAPTLEIPGMKEVGELFQKRYGKPMDVSTASIFSDVAVIIDALERGKDPSPKGLREHMARAELKLGERGYFLLRGVQFNKIGDNDRASGLVSVIRNGSWVPVAPQEIAKGEATYPKPAWS